MPDSFTHLHVHTEFSMLDGAARVGEVVAKAAADGQPAIGITDHGNMYGVLDFYQACQEARASSRSSAPSSTWPTTTAPSGRPGGARSTTPAATPRAARKAYYHLTALAENDVGYKNLIQLSSRAYLEGYYIKPKVDWELLERPPRGRHRHHRLPRRPRAAGAAAAATTTGALEKAARLQDIFGRDNLFVELQDHGIPEQHRTNPQLLEIAQQHQGAAARHQRQPLHPPATTPWPTTPCCACRPARS